MPKVLKTTSTPNPNALKFHLDVTVVASGTVSFNSKEEAQKDVTAKALFDISQITSVFFFDDIVTVSKSEEETWEALVPRVADILEENIQASIDSNQSSSQAASQSAGGSYKEMSPEQKLSRIEAVLDETVRPGLAGDGGGLKVLGLEGDTLKISYQGACGSCPSALMGTLFFIQQTLKKMVDADIKVVAG